MRACLLLGSLCLALGGPWPAHAATQGAWVQEVNARFGFRFSYPAGSLQPLPLAPNGDGRAYRLPGSRADLRAYGSWLPESLPEQKRLSLNEFEEGGGEREGLREGPGWVAMWGRILGGQRLWRRTLALPQGGFATLRFAGPPGEAARLQALFWRCRLEAR